MMTPSRRSLPAICSGDQYIFKCVTIYFFNHSSFSIFFFRCVFLSLVSLLETDGRYFPFLFPLLISLQILVGFFFRITPISILLMPVLSRTASLTRSSRVKCEYDICPCG